MTLLRAPRSIGATIAALTLLLTGCREEPVRTYRTAKETPPPAADPHAGPDHARTPDAGALPPGHPPLGTGPASAPAATTPPVSDSLTWAAPDHWAAKPLGAMRRGSFTARTAA